MDYVAIRYTRTKLPEKCNGLTMDAASDPGFPSLQAAGR